MKKTEVFLLLLCLAGAIPLAVQAQPAPDNNTAEQQARILETDLVRMVKNLLAKRGGGAAGKSEETDKPRRAELPEPEAYDAVRFKNQLGAWKEKSILMVETLEEQKILDMEARHEQQNKKLLEKLKKQEKVIMNPKKRPGGEREHDALGKALEREMDRLEERQESELRKIRKETNREIRLIEQLAKDLQKALSGKKRNR